MDTLTSFLGRSGYLPHGYCFTWTPDLLWSMVGADAIIAMAYFSIPLAIVSFVRKRDDSPMNWVPGLFSAFIFACGITHLMDIWTIWQPDYGLQALTKVATAAISIVTAIALWLLIPKALKVPSVNQLQSVIKQLEAEFQRRRTAEDHLGDVQQSLAVTLASVEAGFIATDREGRVIRMNAVAERVTGWQEDEARGQGIGTVFACDGPWAGDVGGNPVDTMIARCVTVDLIQHVVAISRNGTRTAIELKAGLTRADDGTERGLAMVFRDMTRLMHAEAESTRLAAIVESSNDAIIGLSLDGRITTWNRGARTMFSYSADEAIDRTVQMLIPPPHRASEMQMLADFGRTSKVPTFETVRVTKDGAVLDVSMTISPIRGADGLVIGASQIVRDISQLKRAEAARLNSLRLEAENRQILEANRLKSQFLANMSHELRTPLNAIIGFSDLLHSGAVSVDSLKHQVFLGHIGTSGRHLLQLINDLLDLSKVEAGKFEFFPERVDLGVLVDTAVATLSTASEAKRIVVRCEIDPALHNLVLDPARMKQVLYNYLSNAIKFTPKGGHVTVRAWPEGLSRFRLEVEDTGIGIPKADLLRLFTEFQQLDASYSKQHQGTGLGLALTRRLIEAQGGSVGVRSEVGVGSVFHLVLSCVADGTERSASAVQASTPDTRRVLVIEEDHRDQSRIVQSLCDAGFQVEAAVTGEQALQRTADKSFDAITLDLLLPDQNGLRVLASIREQGPSRDAPVIGLTMPVARRSAARFTIANVLSKPIQTQQVVQAMNQFRSQAPKGTRVLVIDDDPVARELMRSTLLGIEIEPVCVADGRQALIDIELHRPDAIILDLVMPEFDGFAVLDALRHMPAWANTPVFVWTSMALTDDEYAGLAKSARAILNKGGGELTEMLYNLRRWRQPDPPFAVRSET